MLLKATHLPIVAVIEAYEWIQGTAAKATQYNGFRGPRQAIISPTPAAKKFTRPQGPVRTHTSSSSLRPDANRYSVIYDTPKTRPRQVAAEEAEEGRAFGEVTSDVEVRIADLTAKIDRLTELVVAMHAQQSKPLGDVTLV